VRDSGHADRYPQMKVKYIDHHNPDLFLFDKDGEEMQRIDLTRLRTLQNIHKLCQMLGLRESCRDEHANCADWQQSGQCDMNPSFMHQSCRRACGLCKESGNETTTLCRNSAEDSECEFGVPWANATATRRSCTSRAHGRVASAKWPRTAPRTWTTTTTTC